MFGLMVFSKLSCVENIHFFAHVVSIKYQQYNIFIIYRKLIENKSNLNESAAPTQSVGSPSSLKVSNLFIIKLH